MGLSPAERQRRHRIKRACEIALMPNRDCACGCGTRIAPINKRGVPATFAHGHNDGGEETRFKKGEGSGVNNVNWKGGRTVFESRKGGARYALVWVGVGHPMAKSSRASHGFEHRVVMAEAIGRPLRKEEQVHHINGDTLDNRLENLQLRQGHHGSGVAYRCCDCGSHNVAPTQLLDKPTGQTHLAVNGGVSL